MISDIPLAFFVVILGFILHTSQSLRFDLQSCHTKCISEGMKINSTSVEQYYVINLNPRNRSDFPFFLPYNVTARVTSDEMFYLRDREDEMRTLKGLTNSSVFWWKTGVAAKDWGDVANGSIDAMELELKNLMDTVSGIHDKMVYLRDREIQWWKSFTYFRTLRLKAGFAAENWVDIAKEGSIEPMELELKKLMDTVSGIHDEIVFIRDRGAKKGLLDAVELELKKLMDTVSEIHDEIVYLHDRERQTHRGQYRRIDWVYSFAAKDWVDSKKMHLLDAMELDLKKLMDTVSGIQLEMVYLRDFDIIYDGLKDGNVNIEQNNQLHNVLVELSSDLGEQNIYL